MVKLLLQDAKILLFFISLSCLLIFLDNFKVLNFPKATLQYITNPIQYGLYKLGLSASRQFDFIFLTRSSAQEKKAMEEQLFLILSENANLRRKLAEFEAFSAQQASLNPQTFTQVAARPIGVLEKRYLLIDKGSNEGLKIDQPVVYKDSFLGKIKEVSPKQSKVLLSTDPDSRIAAFASNTDGKSRGVLIGQFNVEMLLDKVLHREVLKKGDLVYSEGAEVSLPRGLILGVVSEVLERENEIFKQAKVKPMFEIGNLDVVFVITN